MSPREKIITKALELFYDQGYPNTGINQILSESGTFKASLYKYFKSKDDLGLEYLKKKQLEFQSLMERLMSKHKHYRGFIRGWASLLKREAKLNANYRGCAVANFSVQTPVNTNVFQDSTREIVLNWLDFFEQYFHEQRKQGHLGESLDPKRISMKIFQLYEGTLQLYNMTRNIEFIENLEFDLIEAIESHHQ